MSLPELKKECGATKLYVNQRPFLVLGGEVHNSSATTTEYMETVWDKAVECGLNTVLLPITWELLEPQEDVFDFALIDELIAQAREHCMKIGLLWFGSWKNAQCYFVPEWVKTDTNRFRRAEAIKGKKFIYNAEFHNMAYSTMSYLCEETNKADAKAFAALMNHIKEVDSEENTVIMVQVENEPGLQGAARENSDEADLVFASKVPQNFIEFLRNNTTEMATDVKNAVENGATEGDWKAVFGDLAEEIFSAYHVARYTEQVAAAGKEVYSIPLFVNCWLDKGQKPGRYPSGGPVARMMEVWQFCAPSIEVYAVDNYMQNYCEICDEYLKLGNPLFVPETGSHSHAGPRLIYMVGHYHALGFAPFAFEDMGKDFTASDGYLFNIDVTDVANFSPMNVEEYRWINKTLHDMTPMLVDKYGTHDLQAVIKERDGTGQMVFGDYGFRVMMDTPLSTRPVGACLGLRVSENEFFLIANACMIMPYSASSEFPYIDILALEEGSFENGKWKMHRRLNGDEVASQRYNEPVLLRIKIHIYD
ncbi:DUF5597 domain-containing protein [Ruminococcaceae bacterium OttesenSCG-928-A11]|nr:DUF5597 domain-containing protein [Ruminococcaceae bacterium OttesenSCG-928-A11]